MRIEEVVELSRTVAARIDSRLHVEGVTSAEAGASRAEVLVAIEGCEEAPCSLMLNLDRSNPETVERELEELLVAAVASHLPSKEG